MIFEVSILDLDQPFVKLVAKLMAHPVDYFSTALSQGIEEIRHF